MRGRVPVIPFTQPSAFRIGCCGARSPDSDDAGGQGPLVSRRPGGGGSKGDPHGTATGLDLGGGAAARKRSEDLAPVRCKHILYTALHDTAWIYSHIIIQYIGGCIDLHELYRPQRPHLKITTHFLNLRFLTHTHRTHTHTHTRLQVQKQQKSYVLQIGALLRLMEWKGLSFIKTH